MQFQGQVALVTGASRGIGACTSELIARRGARVALGARTTSDLEILAQKIKASGGEALVVPCDVLNARPRWKRWFKPLYGNGDDWIS